MALEGRRIVVTGGAGFIGSHLVDRLARRNQVTVIDDLSTGAEENLREARRATLAVADIGDGAAIGPLLAGADVVFHLATANLRVSIGDPLASVRVNDAGTVSVLLAALRAGVGRFVYVSSSEVYGSAERLPMDEDHPLRGRTPYAAGKLAGEAYALSFHRTYGLPVAVVRPFNTYGPRAHVAGPSGELIPRFVARALAGLPVHVFGDGAQTRDFTWVSDTVRGIELAACSEALVGGVVNVARGAEVSVLQVADAISRHLGRQVPVVFEPERPGDVRRHVASTAKAQQLLGFRARVGFEEGLGSYIEWVRGRPGCPEGWLGAEPVTNWTSNPAAV